MKTCHNSSTSSVWIILNFGCWFFSFVYKDEELILLIEFEKVKKRREKAQKECFKKKRANIFPCQKFGCLVDFWIRNFLLLLLVDFDFFFLEIFLNIFSKNETRKCQIKNKKLKRWWNWECKQTTANCNWIKWSETNKLLKMKLFFNWNAFKSKKIKKKNVSLWQFWLFTLYLHWILSLIFYFLFVSDSWFQKNLGLTTIEGESGKKVANFAKQQFETTEAASLKKSFDICYAICVCVWFDVQEKYFSSRKKTT